MTLVWGALSLGAVYALVAIGYNIVYIASKSFNFAHAQLMMIGTFIAYTGLMVWGWNPLIVAVLAAVLVAAVALVEERLAVRPVDDHHMLLVTTLGAATLLNGATQLVWGAQALRVPFFAGGEVLTVLGGRVAPVEIALILVAILFVVAFALVTKRTKLGLALLGMAEDNEAARLRGVHVRRLAMAAFVFSGMVAGLTGMVVGPKTFAVATLGSALALKGFVVLAIGGFGSMPGVLVGGALVGLVESFAARYLGSEFATLSVFVMLIAILMIRPTGLFVRSVERTV
ncbi:branched-chain amino acid ABC transporter permease [Enemella sp. A6]|uniref:branched-chain amino acid ABC transporter permease n=1 Tax=Enemella sp. A6 TaxID=3440152 RepID=UPI003EBC495E